MVYPLENVTDEELEDFVDYVLNKLWKLIWSIDNNHPYWWAIHNLYIYLESNCDSGGVREWVEDVFDGEPNEFVPWFDQIITSVDLLIRAGKSERPLPLVCRKPILEYLRGSNRPRHLTEIIGMLAEKEDTHVDRGRLSSYLSGLQKQGLVRNRICPVRGHFLERGYWWADDKDPEQLNLVDVLVFVPKKRKKK